MRQKKGEGTKIAQAAKELGVTSVTIRRYITEFDIETTADENGIKVLPSQAMEELQEIRKLKEEGLTNPKVLEILEEARAKSAEKPKSKEKDKDKDKEKEEKKEKEKEKPEPVAKRATRKVEAPIVRRKVVLEEPAVEEEPEEEPEAPIVPAAKSSDEDDDAAEHEDKDDAPIAITSADGKSKYSLTCQTCNKVFEHMNPRLRDCLDCYRIKRKERRRGGDKNRSVIQNPIAQQVVNKQNQQAQLAQQAAAEREPDYVAPPAAALGTERTTISAERTPTRVAEPAKRVLLRDQLSFAPVGTTPSVYQRTQVRSYRKAIEETRGITSNLKRRLERPDLPEAERRFLEQIYAYQLILHQGWKHLSEYRQMDSTSSGSSSSSGRSHDNNSSGDR